MHLHHRLLQIGHSHRRVVLLIYMWVGIVALGAASTIFFDPRYTGVVMLAAILVAIVITLIPLLRRREASPDERVRRKVVEPVLGLPTMWYGAGRTRKTSRVAGPGPSVHQPIGAENDRQRELPLGDSSAPDALRYARRARTGINGAWLLVTRGIEVKQ